MFLSNTLALFRPPVHLHVQAAPPASSSPTHNQPHHPSIHVSYFTSSFTSTPPEPPHAAAGAGAATNKQLVPKVISRCSPTQSTPTKINSNSPILSQSRAQLRAGTKAQEGHEVRPNQWNPIFFPKPPTPPTMVKDDSTLRKAAAITPPTKTPTKTSVLSYLHSPAGQKFLDNLEREALLKRKSSRPEFGASTSSPSPSAIAVDDRTQHDISLERRRKSRRDGVDSKIPNGSTSPSECQATRNRDCGRDTSVGHVATSAWSEDVCSQSPDSHFTGADAGSIRSSRVTTDADVFDSEDLTETEDIPIRSKLSHRDQLNFKECFDQLLRGTSQDSKTNEMGLGRLEFGYPFQLHPPGGTKHPLKKEPPTKPPAVQVPGRVLPTVSSHGIVPQPLPPRSQVVLITDASQDPTSIDQRGLPSGSSVVLVIDQQYDVHFHDPRSAGKSPDTVGSLSKTKRRNPLRDTVRLRWSVFHPEYTEKSEFVFQPSQQQSSRPEPKRKLSVTLIEQKSKRTRDDDVEGLVFNEKPAAIVEDPVAEPASQSAVRPVAVVVEDPISADLDTEPIQQLATPPPELELVPEIEVEETEVANVEIIQQQPSPPPSPATTPIPLKFDAEEEAVIKEAIKEAMGVGEPSQSEVETEVEAEADSDVDAFAIDLSTLPPLPESEPASPAIEPVQVEDDNDMDDEINLATLPALPDPDSPLVEPTEVEEQGDAVPTSLQLDDMSKDDKPQADAIPPRQMIQQPSPPPSEPGTPVMDTKKDDVMKVVPWMPLTPPETPLSMRHGRERVIEFNMTIPLYMQPPSTPSSILDSPVFFRGKDRQLEDGPTHYFIPAPPSPSSPSHSILDSPLASRMRRIGETIKEEEEEGEEEEVEVEAKAEELPAVVVIEEEEEDENDVEEIVRSPQLSYPSPPSSPMPSVIDSPVSKGKELSRVPSFTIIYSPSPPPSIRDVLMYDEDKSIAPSPASEAPISSKGKEREVLLEKTLPSPVLEQEEFEQDEEEGLNHRSTIYPSGWATADDIFTNPDHQYTYQYNSRPPTPASSIGSLSRRWSGISRMSYNTAITTPPATRPGSAIGGTPTGNHKLISWSDNDHLLRRTDSFASSIRRELFRDQSTSRTRKPLLVSADTSTEKKRPALRWSVSMPLIREQWTIRYPLVVSPAEKGFMGLKDEDVEEYDVHIPGSIQLLPLTRGVIVTPPRIERRRRIRTTSSAGPHRRKVRSLVVYSPDEQLEGIGQLFGDLHELSDVEDEIAAAERIVEIVETVGTEQKVPREVVTETVKEQEEVVEVLKEKKKSVLKRLKTRASALKEKVKVKVHSSKKGKEKANGATVAV